MKIIETIFTKALKQKHDYDVTNKFDYNDSKFLTRFIAVGSIFYMRNRARTLRTYENKTGHSK